MIMKIYREGGLSGFYRGIVPSLILTLNPVIQFTTYDLMKAFISKSRNGKVSSLDLILISLTTKLFTVLSNYPLITTKTLFQANTKLSACQMLGLLKNMYSNEGILGFYKGIGTKVVGSLLNNIILMLIYEKVQHVVRLVLARILLKEQIIPHIN
jgi:adenine nucleotide transporter 17